MNILNLATTDEGGAGIASRNINDFFLKNAHNSVLLVKESKSKNNNVIAIQKAPGKSLFHFYLKKIKRRLAILNNQVKIGSLDSKYNFHNIDESKLTFTAKKLLSYVPFNPDIIILHWVSGFVVSEAIKQLFEITKARLFWIMMDNASLTGGCHYPWNCKGYYSNCFNCPAILNSSKKKFAERNLSVKKKYLPSSIELIACSESDYKRVSKASVFKEAKIHKLLLPIDENRFIPGNKGVAKSFFGINPTRKVIFYGASLSDIRKGGKFFIESLKILRSKLMDEAKNVEDILILVAGKEDKDYFKNVGIPIYQVGYLSEEKLIKAYQAADVFVCTSIEDSGPLMINQSLMCATPVAAFEIGVALDLVYTGETGYKANLFNSIDLANGIYNVLELSENEYKQMSNNCREVALKLCSYEAQISLFENIFKN